MTDVGEKRLNGNGRIGRSKAAWAPGRLDSQRPPYLALLKAIDDDIGSGVLQKGMRLPPHRVLARQLGLSLSTVTKAYHEASVRGIVVSRIGQGTFVASAERRDTPRGAGQMINLATNVSPDVGQRRDLADLFAAFSRGDGLDGLFASDWHQGYAQHRAVLAGCIATGGFRPGAEQIITTNGAQHGLDLALHILCKPGDTILVEDHTYVGFKAQAQLYGYNLAPVGMDGEGLLPDALDACIRETKARAVYAMPTLQSPTARTMSARRRTAIADIIRRHQVHLIEDDVYGFLFDSKPEPLAALIPELTLYVSSFSKIFGLGYRAGVLVVPPALVDRARLALRANAWSATPILFEIVCQLATSGRLDHILGRLRDESRRRVGIFDAVFGRPATPGHASYHVWLPLPAGRTANELFFLARDRGVLVTPPGSASPSGEAEHGVRLCLGAPERGDLEKALSVLRGVLDQPVREAFSVA